MTIHTEEDDIDADNVSFLRTPLDSAQLASSQQLTQGLRTERRRLQLQHRDRSLSDEARERRLRERHLRADYTSHEEWAEAMRSNASRARSLRGGNNYHSPYSDQVPSQQSLYDWAPAAEAEADEDELEAILSDLRQQQPNTHPDIIRVLGQAQLDADRESRSNRTTSRLSNAAPAGLSHETSLRSAAILQSVRRNRQLSARSRDLVQRFVLDRDQRPTHGPERSNRRESEGRDRWLSVAQGLQQDPGETSLSDLNRLAQQAWQRSESVMPPAWNESSVLNVRQQCLEDPRHVPVKFEKTIRLLDELRNPDVELDDVMKGVKIPETISAHHFRDNVSRIREGFPPPKTSWLSPGLVFSGFQQAAPMPTASTLGTTSNEPGNRRHNSNSVPLYRHASSADSTGNSNNAQTSARSSHIDFLLNMAGPGAASQPSSPASSQLSSPHTQPHQPSPQPAFPPSRDRWTVRVALHAVDYETMTLQATMEAFNVPSVNHNLPHPNPPTKTTFSTYLEGELLDHTQHTFRTHTFRGANSSVDARYWRKLEPFAGLSDNQLEEALLDPEWMQRELTEKYVLMRWKERCFVREARLNCFSRGARCEGLENAGVDAMSVHTPRDLRLNPAAAHPRARRRSRAADESRVPHDRDGGDDADAEAEEPSFLPGADGNGYGLSISGFYYVCMRRGDGRCEGLYHDPQSSPYQRLELWPERGKGSGGFGVGVWEFR